MSRTTEAHAEVTLISSENFILFTPMPFRPESEKKVIGLLRSIWRHGESTARINSAPSVNAIAALANGGQSYEQNN